MGALLDAVPAGGADHTEHHRDLATAVEAAQLLDSDLTAIAALTTTAYGRSLLTLADQAALQTEAGGGGGGTPGVDYPTSATFTLSSADILDLHNTPITLVAAPGAGKFLICHRVIEYLTYGTVAYTVSGTTTINWAGEAAVVGEIATLDSGVSSINSSDDTSVYVQAANAVNKALTVSSDAALTDGDGTLTVTVWYTIEDVPA